MNFEFLKWLDETIKFAKEDKHESIKDDPNCFGAGYDTGYLSALEEAKREYQELSGY